MPSAKSPTTFGEDELDLREGLSGLPFERMMGVLGVRGRDALEAVDWECVRLGQSGMKGDLLSVGDSGDEVGNGTLESSGESSGALVLKVALVFGISMCEGGLTVGEKRPDSMESRSELTDGRGAGRTTGEDDGEWSSSWGESSSTLRWKTALLLDSLGFRRRGRLPMDTNAPGPRSSLKEERVRR